MFNLINRTANYSLHSLLGFDIHKLSLAPFYIQEPTLNLVSQLYSTGKPLLALSKKDKKDQAECETIEKISHELQTLLLINNYDIEIKPLKVHLIDENLNKIVAEQHFTSLNSKYVFLETSETTEPQHIYNSVFDIQLQNLIPVLNFPEKNLHFTTKNQRLSRLRDRGCVFKIDLLSLTGHFVQPAKKTAIKLLETKQVQFISFQIQHIELINKTKGIRIPRKVANLLDDQLFIS